MLTLTQLFHTHSICKKVTSHTRTVVVYLFYLKNVGAISVRLACMTKGIVKYFFCRYLTRGSQSCCQSQFVQGRQKKIIKKQVILLTQQN